MSAKNEGGDRSTSGRPGEKTPPVGYLGTPEAAVLMGVSKQTIRHKIRAGTLEGFDEVGPDDRRVFWAKREDVEREAVAKQRQRGEQRGVAEVELSARLDTVSERLGNIETLLPKLLAELERREPNGVGQEAVAWQKRFEAEKAAREVAERERDELRMRLLRILDPEEGSPQQPHDTIGAKVLPVGRIDGHKVWHLRKDRLLNQEVLAAKSKVDRKTIIDIEKGRRPNAHHRTIVAIAQALDVPPEELMTRDQSPA
jgi:DNA-binding XRE family transcriptional regulator